MAKAAYLKDDRGLISNLAWNIYLDSEDKTIPSKRITELVNLELTKRGKRTISQSLIDQIMAIIHEKERKGELVFPVDKPWSIGTCLKYDIPKEFVTLLSQIRMFAKLFKSKVTLRQAKWFVFLYPSVQNLVNSSKINVQELILKVLLYKNITLTMKEAEFILETFKRIESTDEKAKRELLTLIWLYFIGIQYARWDLISAATGKNYADTTELDDLYFLKGEISAEVLLDGLSVGYSTPEQRKQREELLNNFKSLSKSGLEPIFGDLGPSEVVIANDFLKAFYGGYASAEDWKKHHAEEFSILTKKSEDKQNERLSKRE